MIGVLASFAAMIGVALLGLALVGASSVVSLVPAALGVVALAVGGSAEFGTGASADGAMAVGLEGSLRVMPLGVTLVGAIVLGLSFYLPLRGRRPDAGLLGARLAAAAGTGVPLLLVLGQLSSGTVNLPESLTSRMMPSGSGDNASMGGMMEMLGGTGGGVPSSVDYRIDQTATFFGGLLWLTVVLGLGLLAARRARFPRPVAASGLRVAGGPAASATIAVVLVLVLALLLLGTAGGLALAPPGNGPRIVGAILLVGPNLMLAILSVGVGLPWSLSTETGDTGADAGGGPAGMLGGMMPGGMGDMGGMGNMGGMGDMGGLATPMHRSISLASMATDGPPLWLPLVVLVVVVLLVCGALTAVRTPPVRRRKGQPAETRIRRAKAHALRLGTVWAGVLFTVALVGGLTGGGAMSMMGMSMMNMDVHVGAHPLLAAVIGLLAGGSAGFLGSLLLDTVRQMQIRVPIRRTRSAT